MTTTPPTPDAAGPVEAVVTRALNGQSVHLRDGLDGNPTRISSKSAASLGAHVAAALAPLFAEHGAAERRAGAVEAWDEGARSGHHSPLTWFALRQCNPYRAAALGDRVNEAVEASEGGHDDTLCAEHRDGKPGVPHEWRRGRRGHTRVVTCNPAALADRAEAGS